MHPVTPGDEVVLVFSVPFVHALERARSRGTVHYDTRRNKEAKRAIWQAYTKKSMQEHGEVVSAPKGVPVTVTVSVCRKPTKEQVRQLRKLEKQMADLPLWLREPVSLPNTRPPDIDNVVKLVLDALNPTYVSKFVRDDDGHAHKARVQVRGGAWVDDSQVCEEYGLKKRITQDATDLTTVTIKWTMPKEEQ